jgi:hypothetical protein
MKKAAVVIGVNKTGNLTPLTSAAPGAERVAKWLESEGFDVKCITDNGGAVDYQQVENAIESFVTLPASYDLLVVYFSGHGYWQARSDVWLLSGAPTKTREAINLETAMDLAKYSGIPNVVFVSDACRSIPNSRTGANVDGGGAFPNYDEVAQASKVDYFKATSEALAAYEGRIRGQSQSLLTAALMSAYEEPEAQMVLQVSDGGATIEVVPNRRLEVFLQKKVNALLADIDPNLTQVIDVNVPSSDDVYLSRVRRRPPTAAMRPAAPAPQAPPPAPQAPPAPAPQAPQPGRAAARAISRHLNQPVLFGGPGGGAAGAGATLEISDPATEKRLQRRMPDLSIDHFETGMGFVVRGAVVKRVVTPQAKPVQSGADLLDPGDGAEKVGVIRVSSGKVVSMCLQTADGRGVVLAALPSYIGHVTFNDQGLANVSYVPSSNDGRWYDYKNVRGELDRLRAAVALAVDSNTFRLKSDREAKALAEKIRPLKLVDPTLGLYAAHAYSQAGMIDEIASVMHHMQDDFSADFFDVRLLASRGRGAAASRYPVVPLCPMLTQSWHLLSSRKVKLPETLQKASAYLCGSLWTTFEPEGADPVFAAFEKGELQ